MSTKVHVWTDPSCPWAWQAFRWLRWLARDGAVALSFDLFSLEVNASEEGLAFDEAAPRYGAALTLLELVHERAGDDGFARVLEALGGRLHERKDKIETIPFEEVLIEAGLGATLFAEAVGDRERLGAAVIEAFHQARSRDVFGVPTLAIEDDKVVYGPILAVGPEGADAHELFAQVKALADRGTFFELKRWPRDLRPGGAPVGEG